MESSNRVRELATTFLLRLNSRATTINSHYLPSKYESSIIVMIFNIEIY